MTSIKDFIISHKTNLLGGIVWLFHISALIGIWLGYFDWFVTKTPLNLAVLLLVLIAAWPERSLRTLIGFLIFMVVGMVSEYLGVEYGLIFGAYEYGDNLGPKVAGVPWMIGVNWAILVVIGGAIASAIGQNRWIKAAIGAWIMVVLDLVMEPVAPLLDFWVFDNSVAPLQNYIGWFTVGFVLQLVYPYFFRSQNRTISYHLYLAQFVFFTGVCIWMVVN